MGKRVVTGFVLAGLLGLAAPSCEGNDCLGVAANWGSCSQGDSPAGNVWETSPIDGPYLDFHGERQWTFDPRPWMGTKVPIEVNIATSFSPYPDAEGGIGAAPGAGNDAEYTPITTPTGTLIQVLNDTCAQFYVRVVVTYVGDPTTPNVCKGDGGT